MKRLYSTDDRVMAGHIHSILEEQGIRCMIKNQSLAGAVGELPPIECWPEIWIIDDEDFEYARDLIQAFASPLTKHTPDWKCACGETVEGQFRSCWNCGRTDPLYSG
jgi:hypothetical protein